MALHLPEQLQRFSDKIRDEEMSFVIEEMVKAYLPKDQDETENEYPRTQTEREKYASLLLRTMRIHLCLDLIRQGHTDCIEVLLEDWDKIIECLQFLEYTFKVPNELLGDAADIILLLDPAKRNDLLRLLDFPTRIKIKKQKPLRFHVADCAFHMAVYCLQTDRTDEMLRIMANLVSLSEERNAGDLNKHRAITAQALYYTVDNSQPLTLRICEAQKKYYDGIVSKAACRFYWFYGFAVMQGGRYKESVPLFRHCYDLAMETEGETSWTGARAGSFYHQYTLLSGASPESEHYLWDSLKKIDSGFYADMDATADFFAANNRAILLTYHLSNQTMQGLLPEILRFRDYCVSAEETNMNPNLTVRHAENMLAAYYMETGDYLQAADHSRNALHSVSPNNLPREPSDILIYSNLLLIYTALNDTEQMDYYVQTLTELFDDYKDDGYVMHRVSHLINTAAKKVHLRSDDLEQTRQYLDNFHEDICSGEPEPSESDIENITFAQWLLDLCSDILDSFTADDDELLRLRTIVTYFLDRPDIFKFNSIQKCSCYTLLTQIEWQLGSPRTLRYLEKCLHYVDAISESREARISILRFAAVIYYTCGRRDLSVAMVEKVLSGITAAWQKATAYLNDRRVCRLLSFIQMHFGLCYAILRTCAAPEALYERVLQFKDLPALVGRERNKLLRLAPVDEQLKEQIFKKQDQLAAAELNDSLNGTDTAQAISAQLEHLEAEFAAQFPQNLYFTPITYRRICEKLPDNSAIAEYFFALNETSLTGRPYEEDALELDVFVTAKRDGVTGLHHLKLRRGDIILHQAERFISILQHPEDDSTAGEKASLRGSLYRSLIAPLLPLLEGITNLYIAPDDQLCNLPFEILYADGSGLLQDRYRVCRLVCGRDLLFYDDQGPTGGSCFILGDPNYESERGEITADLSRGAYMRLVPMAPLPFSRIEAARIGQRCHARICTGDAATKYALQAALPCRIIHLATHGVFDDQPAADSLYASHLVFAGYNKWVTNRTASRFCGNGILTADEISRMELHKTELVVLSACQSGLGDTSYGSVQGLLSAFSAAGARWVISHMWSANDFAAPILMDAFYDAWLNRGMDVPDALQYAKNFLRTATIDTLRRNGWLIPPRDARIPEVMRREIQDMSCWPGDIIPFEDEYFWGGFTVHKTR